MSCFSPLRGYRSKHVEESGKRRVVFNIREGWPDRPVHLACGKCIGCRIDAARSWAVRCAHEASLYQDNAFLTLTYSDDFLPRGGDLVKRDLQLFMKRLRKRIFPTKVRFFACGEYGEVCFYCTKHKTACCCPAYKPMTGRPHFHILLFGFDFQDKTVWSRKNGYFLFRSRTLEELWPFGFSTIGSVTYQSAGYVARYAMKKVGGPGYDDKYLRVDRETGELFFLQKEFVLMSRGRRADGDGGIGYRWFMKYKDDLAKDFITVDRKKHPVPKYYDGLQDPELLEEIKTKRRKEVLKRKGEYTPERLATKEAIKTKQLAKLMRELQ